MSLVNLLGVPFLRPPVFWRPRWKRVVSPPRGETLASGEVETAEILTVLGKVPDGFDMA
jgi:hypothetical protein